MIELPDLPYALDALSPHISADTLSIHHGKHHRAYVTKLNSLIEGTDLSTLNLDEIIKRTAGKDEHRLVYNNAAQIWNHTFYWNSMTPDGGGKPTGEIAALIDKSFGSFDEFRLLFETTAASQFGSGWVWLTGDREKLEITSTANADLPLASGKTALLTMDVWEHAYYLDYQNRRLDYTSSFLNNLVNWDFANHNLSDG